MEVQVDSRGRTTLAKVRRHHYERYETEEMSDGTLVLRPVVSISPVELAALQDTAVRAALDEATSDDRSQLRTRPRAVS